MSYTEWSDGIYRVMGDTGRGGEAICSYVIMADQIAVIDPANKKVAKETLQCIEDHGRDPKEISHIILTHSHPDHTGGISTIKKKSPAIVVAHENGTKALSEGKDYILKEQFPLEGTSRFSLALKSFDVFSKRGIGEPDMSVKGGETISLGGETLLLESTGGHSSDHIMIISIKKKTTFIGDEGTIYGDSYYAFYFDKTGDPGRRLKVLNLLEKMKTDLICPAHTPPMVREHIEEYTGQTIFAHDHVKTTVLETLRSISEAKPPYIADQLEKILGVKWKPPYSELQVGTLTAEAFLRDLQKEGLVRYSNNTERWGIKGI